MPIHDHDRQNILSLIQGSLARLLRRVNTTLRAKVLLLLLLTFALLMVLLFIPLKQIFLASFNDLEQRNIEVDLTRVLYVFDSERELQEKLVLEYGAWDDTYNFAMQPDQAYIDDNFEGNMLANRRSSLVLIVNTAGKLVFGRAYDLGTDREMPLPPGYEQLYAQGSKLVDPRNLDHAISGIVQLPGQTMLISAYPVITSLFKGPSHGTIIFGHSLDNTAIRSFSKATQLSIEILRPDDAQLLNELPDAQTTLADMRPHVQAISETLVAGYMLLPDIDGRPGAVLRVAKPRDIYQREQTGVYYAGVVILIMSIIFTIVLMLLLDRAVISRLAALNTNISQIGAHGNLSARVPVDGADEVAQLATTFNTTLAALEQAQRERERAEAAALAMNQRFIATVSHELRTPLTPIQGYVDLLLVDGADLLSADQRIYLQVIEKNVARMAALVEDVLIISNLNSKNIILQIAPTKLHDVASDAIQIFQKSSEQKRIMLTLDLAEQLPLIAVDNRRLYQILWNLLSNALKYTAAGGRIWLRAFARSDNFMEIQVEDTGVGMTAEQQQQLFTPFYRADNPLSISAGGTGLGLAIVREMVELHGGTIWVTSEPGVGSIFTLTLPLADQLIPLAGQPAAQASAP